MRQVTIGPKDAEVKVGEIGYGLMGFTFPGFGPRTTPLDDDEAFEAMKAAIDAGATFWNGGVYYGFGPHGELLNLELVARFFTKYPELADKVFLSVKGGFNPKVMRPDASPEFLRADLEGIKKALNGKKKLDMYEMGRVDKSISIEDTVTTLAGFIKEGYFTHISLSEVGPQTIRRAAKVHPITMVEVEFSLWSTDIQTNGVLDTCKELGIHIAAYSPLGRGILSGRWTKPEDVPQTLKDQYPRYSDENFETNVKFVEKIKEIGERNHATPAQVALKWIVIQGEGIIIPIPGATRKDRVLENTEAASLDLSEKELTEINHFVEITEVKGGRYAADHEHMLWG